MLNKLEETLLSLYTTNKETEEYNKLEEQLNTLYSSGCEYQSLKELLLRVTENPPAVKE